MVCMDEQKIPIEFYNWGMKKCAPMEMYGPMVNDVDVTEKLLVTALTIMEYRLIRSTVHGVRAL